ncbi:MAG: hypothetical protein ABR954_04975 [Dehalococcoidales bacterium]
MWSDKKFIIIIGLLVIAIAVGGTLGGIALARGNNNSGGQARNVGMNNITGLLQPNSGNSSGIQGLIKDFEQAGQEIKSEGLDAYLQQLVKDGKITQEQSDQFKAWLDARPAFPTDEFKKWMESRPDIPGLFGQDNHPGTRFFGMMHNGNGGFGF